MHLLAFVVSKNMRLCAFVVSQTMHCSLFAVSHVPARNSSVHSTCAPVASFFVFFPKISYLTDVEGLF